MSQSARQVTPLVIPGGGSQADLRPDMKTRYLALLLAGALAVGIGSGWMLLGEKPPFGVVRVGPWQSFPRIGSADVDPYGRAILARGAHLPLAVGEGVQLLAGTDSSGAALDGRCSYRISGMTLPSRGWTITVADSANRAAAGDASASVSDGDLVTGEDGRIALTASQKVASGTWLRLPDDGRFGLILRFYDTPASASIGQLSPGALPRIDRLACGSGTT